MGPENEKVLMIKNKNVVYNSEQQTKVQQDQN